MVQRMCETDSRESACHETGQRAWDCTWLDCMARPFVTSKMDLACRNGSTLGLTLYQPLKLHIYLTFLFSIEEIFSSILSLLLLEAPSKLPDGYDVGPDILHGGASFLS